LYDILQEAENKIKSQNTDTWNEKLFFEKFKTNDYFKTDCSTSVTYFACDKWFNITFNHDQNLLSGSDGYLAATFIENTCGKKMNLRFQKFNIPPLISGGVAVNDEMCKMQPGRNFLAIKEIKFDNSEGAPIDKYKKAVEKLKESFNMETFSERPAICVQGQAQELFYGSDKDIYPDGWIIMTYVKNYPAFEELELNRNISMAAMMHKTCPWVFNADETKNVTLSYADKNCVILYSTESHRTKRSGQPGNDHVTEMTLQSDVTHEIEASLYGEDLCLSYSNFPKNNDEKQIHGSVEENTCMDTIELKIKGTEKHVLSTSHMATTLSNKHFFKNPNDKLTLFFDTLDQDDLKGKLSEIQCGIAEDQENPAPWVGSLGTNDNEGRS
jgi:hypothetical protein